MAEVYFAILKYVVDVVVASCKRFVLTALEMCTCVLYTVDVMPYSTANI